MPANPPRLDELPEPADLHARLTANRPLDWGSPLPTKKQLATEFGERATVRGLEMLDRAAAVEADITDDLLASAPSGADPYQVESRMKSPQSLARKLSKLEDQGRMNRPPEDLIRYTVLTPEPNDVVNTAVDLVHRLQGKGWAMDSAHHSYVDGSRYKGLHAFLRRHGELIEVQVHSNESIDVKNRTTPLYEVERDPRQDRAARDAAREACRAMSAKMTHPAGIADLSELGGVPVSVRSYGKKQGTPGVRPTVGEKTTARTSTPQRGQAQFDRQKGISR